MLNRDVSDTQVNRAVIQEKQEFERIVGRIGMDFSSIGAMAIGDVSQPSSRPSEAKIQKPIELFRPELVALKALGRCSGLPIEYFYSDREDETEIALEICRECCVRQECLDYALKHKEEYGVWGGATESERRSILRRRKAAAKSATKA